MCEVRRKIEEHTPVEVWCAYQKVQLLPVDKQHLCRKLPLAVRLQQGYPNMSNKCPLGDVVETHYHRVKECVLVQKWARMIRLSMGLAKSMNPVDKSCSWRQGEARAPVVLLRGCTSLPKIICVTCHTGDAMPPWPLLSSTCHAIYAFLGLANTSGPVAQSRFSVCTGITDTEQPCRRPAPLACPTPPMQAVRTSGTPLAVHGVALAPVSHGRHCLGERPGLRAGVRPVNGRKPGHSPVPLASA